MKVSELSGAELDKLVAKVEGKEVYVHNEYCFIVASQRDWRGNPSGRYSPSTDWSQGGPIIEQARFTMWMGDCRKTWKVKQFPGVGEMETGETLLIAAMRCFVASKFGEEVPNE